MIERETQAPVGYSAMLLESFVGVIALIAASVLVPGDYLRINTMLSPDALAAMGYPIARVDELSRLVEVDVAGRPGGAVSLAVGMASIFAALPGMDGLMAYWYQFALVFEALFILTTIDTGTRVARYLIQELAGRHYQPLRDLTWWPGVISISGVVVGAWGYLIATGSISTIWPMFGAANQLLGTLALCIGTTVLIKMRKSAYLWITMIPMGFVGAITLTGAYEMFLLFVKKAASSGSAGRRRIVRGCRFGRGGGRAWQSLSWQTASRQWYGYVVLKRPFTTSEVVVSTGGSAVSGSLTADDGIRLPHSGCC